MTDTERLDYLLGMAELCGAIGHVAKPALVFGYELSNRDGLTDKRAVVDAAIARGKSK